tara:strand:+ start:1349 stop:2488 length:1140 start_codon:yes stop_codon:yes gene_type:complete
MKINILVVLIFTTTSIIAQNTLKKWVDGPLTWDDFKLKEMQIYGSIPDFHLDYSKESTKNDNHTFIITKVNAFINTNNSSVTIYSRSPQILKYHQVEFNIFEFYRRVFQREALEDLNTQNIEERFNEVLSEMDYTLYQYKKTTLYGSKNKEINEWHKKVEELLKSEKPNYFPEIETRNWGYGGYFGFEYVQFTDDFMSFLNYKWGLSLGFEMNYKQSYLIANLTGISSSLKSDLFLDEQLSAGIKTHFTQYSVSYGYNMLDKPKFNLIPFIGIGGTTFMERTDEENKFTKFTYSYNYGVNFDYKFKSTYNLIPDINNKKHERTLYLRTRLFINNAKFSEDFHGKTINFGIILGLNSRQLNIKTKKPKQSQFARYKNSYQ